MKPLRHPRPVYRVRLARGFAILEARRRNFLWIFPSWQALAHGPAEELQRVAVHLQRLFASRPPARKNPLFPPH